jgi:hypothetical protein
MRWKHRMRKDFPVPVVPEDLTERESALQRSTDELAMIRERQPEIDQIQKDAIQSLVDNHFIQRLNTAYNIPIRGAQ